MPYRFGPFELDSDARELRRDGAPCEVTPQVFAFIRHLIEQRARAVSKAELLDALWPDATVSEGSLQRVVSLARAALDDGEHQIIRTLSGHGYRFVAQVQEGSAPPPASSAVRFEPRYAKSGDVHVAYCTAGKGDLDIVIVLGWAFPMQAMFGLPATLSMLEALSRSARVVMFDKRGTGMSDRVRALPTLEQRMDDLRAVLDEVGSARAILLGISEGGPLSIAFAQAAPERVAGLVLVGSFPRMASAPDYPHGWPRSELGRLQGYVKNGWGNGATMLALLPESAWDGAKGWASDAERAGASPGAALDLLEMNSAIDVRDRLASLRVPCVVLHARADRVSAPENGRYLAERIPDAQLVEVDGDDHAFLFAGRASLLAAVGSLLARERKRGP